EDGGRRVRRVPDQDQPVAGPFAHLRREDLEKGRVTPGADRAFDRLLEARIERDDARLERVETLLPDLGEAVFREVVADAQQIRERRQNDEVLVSVHHELTVVPPARRPWQLEPQKVARHGLDDRLQARHLTYPG